MAHTKKNLMKIKFLIAVIIVMATKIAFDYYIKQVTPKNHTNGLTYLHAPWRAYYDSQRNNQKNSCPFCEQSKDITHDAKHLILKRYQHVYVMLNLYPYNTGHLLIIPYEHVDTLPKLSPPARAELMTAISDSMTILTQRLHAECFNMGANLGGKISGASIPAHLHVHVLPRWSGDTDFMTIISNTKIISNELSTIYNQLKSAFNEYDYHTRQHITHS